MTSYEEIKNNPEINTYIKKASELLRILGFTEHGFAHACFVAERAEYILKTLSYDENEIEKVKIAAYMHDIGNSVNRFEHAQTGALMAFNILREMEFSPSELSDIVAAIGNHDEETGNAVSVISAALILADKSDVRRTRVYDKREVDIDIHDRVNYAVTSSEIKVLPEKKTIELLISIDTEICPVMDYFEIFIDRMLLCRRAAEFLNMHFKLYINNVDLL